MDIIYSQKYKLKSLLGKLGIASAKTSALEDAINHMFAMSAADFGRPDTMMISSTYYDELSTIVKGTSNKGNK